MSAPVTVSTFYSFVPLADARALRTPILARMRELGIRGTITLASEGINATISGAAEAIESLMVFLKTQMAFTTPTFRESYFGAQPFKRTKVKVKRELISLGVPTFPAQCVGQYVHPADWNTLITSPDVMIIDTRNDYEFVAGHFVGAVNPATRDFKGMVKWTEVNLLSLAPPLRGLGTRKNDTQSIVFSSPRMTQGSLKTVASSVGGNSDTSPPTDARSVRVDSPSRGELPSARRIAMYCTGGIRCDKYSSYLVSLGFTEVYHLHGGILAYLEHIPEAESLWRGSCFVFDERVAVGHGLVPVVMD